jgi:hypothetical protein
LSAEPLNLLCYLALLILVFRLGGEVFDERVGLIAALIVALWPSLLLHTTQLLRDSLFLPAMLAFVLVCVRFLTRDYPWPRGLLAGIEGGVIALLLWAVRSKVWEVIVAVVLLGAVLFVVRQVGLRRVMIGNMAGLVLLLAITCSVPLFVPPPVDYMTRPNGAPLVGKQDLPPAAVGSPPLHAANHEQPQSVWARLWTRIGDAREKFKRQFPQAGSNIDADVQFNSPVDVIRYLPRALAIGLFAPFPRMWFAAGERVGVPGRLLSGLEMLTIYVIEMLALFGLWQSRRRLPAWLLLLIVIVSVTALGLVVTNLAALYRMRYVFWILLILLGAKGATFRPRRTPTATPL